MQLLGLAVLYTVYGAEVSRDQMVDWFAELGLDADGVPQLPRRADAFVLATREAKLNYSQPWRGPKVTAAVSIQRVDADRDRLVFRMIRQNRENRPKGEVTVDTVADVIFLKKRISGDPGPYQLGKPEIRMRQGTVHERERDRLHALVSELRQRYYELCHTLNSDRVRGVVRDYITTNLRGVRLKPNGGGDYFVLPAYADEARRLAQVVNRFGGLSAMDWIEVPDLPRHRTMVERGIGLELGQDVAELAADARRRHERYRGKLKGPFRELMDRCQLYLAAGLELPARTADELEELYELLDSGEDNER